MTINYNVNTNYKYCMRGEFYSTDYGQKSDSLTLYYKTCKIRTWFAHSLKQNIAAIVSRLIKELEMEMNHCDFTSYVTN